jgi:hypothetical protein
MEELAAQRQQQTAPTVAEEAEVADAWEAPGKNVLLKSPEELAMSKRHRAALAVVRVVLPAECRLTVCHVECNRWLEIATRCV